MNVIPREAQDAEAAQEAVNANTSPRAKMLDSYERYVTCDQYAGRPNWYDDRVPLWEREPCIKVPLVAEAIESHTDLLLGEGRFPTATTRTNEDDSDWDESGLGEDDSELADRFIVELGKESRFRAHTRAILAQALGCGTAVGIFGHKHGRICTETTRAKWCTPTFDDEGDCLKSLEIRYPYLDAEKQADGKWKVKCWIYRRVIDDVADTLFAPALADRNGAEPKWLPLKNGRVEHGYGFCPAIWYPLLKTASTVTQIDGIPVHAHCLDAIVGLDVAVSQRHSAALFVGAPQICEFGVGEDFSPTETGRKASVPATLLGGTTDPRDPMGNPARGEYRDPAGSQGPARKKGPGYVWRYPNPDSKVQMLELSGDALKALDEHASDLRNKICEALAFVPLDPENVKFAATLSAKAIEALRARQLDRCDKIRDDFGESYLIPAVNMQLRIASKARAVISTPGLKKVAKILDKFGGKSNAPRV